MSSSRSVGTPGSPVNAATVVVRLRGRDYCVCSDKQMSFLLDQHRQFILLDANDRKETLTPEMVEERLAEYRVVCGYDTMDHLLSLMNADEQRQWRDNYRFSGIHRAKAEQ